LIPGRFFFLAACCTPERGIQPVYSLPQQVIVVIFLLVYLSLYLFRNRISLGQRLFLRYAIAVFLVVNELTWHIWNITAGAWTIQGMLPLHICTVMVFASAVLLVTRSHLLYEFQYFLGIGAASQILFTPDAGMYAVPNFLFFQTFIAHGLVIFTALYMTFVEGFRPTLRSLGKVAVGMNLYMLAVGLINIPLGSNYLFLMQKPPIPSLLDFLGPWPWYILGMEAAGAVICILLYLPFLLRDWINRHRKPDVL
jgi:hypothetical integral membrane protein (TIGR02206 family)